jgi:two-component system cell cycle sensor histidine kinase/response regulator CckA
VNLEPVVLNTETKAESLNLPGGSYLKLTVKDNGQGMTPDVQERIFEPFFTTRKNKGGSGLGLPVVYALVTHNRGAITVDSTPGIGTAFHVFFPRVNQEETIAGPPPGVEVKGGAERILLVDDDPDLRYAMAKMLKTLGYTVQTAATGIEALEIFNRDPGRFDLLITDQTMPGMKGSELATHILSIRPEIPIILCSGYQIDSNAHESQTWIEDAGIRFFIRKPITCVEIAGAIRAALENDVKPTSQER